MSSSYTADPVNLAAELSMSEENAQRYGLWLDWQSGLRSLWACIESRLSSHGRDSSRGSAAIVHRIVHLDCSHSFITNNLFVRRWTMRRGPGAGQKPLPHNYDPEKFTDMTMQLVRQLIHKVYQQSPTPQEHALAETNRKKEMRLLIDTTLEKIQMLYLRHCNPSIPLHRGVLLGLANNIKWKFWIMFFHRFQRQHRSLCMTPEMNSAQEEDYEPFRWHLDSYSGFRAASYILLQLSDPSSRKELGPALVERGRKALQGMRDVRASNIDDNNDNDNDSKVWTLLRKIDLVNHQLSSDNQNENTGPNHAQQPLSNNNNNSSSYPVG
ncbi:hypothetical protein VTN96DRAFT_7852 [Rasamsonia emersonii]